MIININYDNENSIKKAERKKTTLENKGLNLIETKQTGFNEFALYYV